MIEIDPEKAVSVEFDRVSKTGSFIFYHHDRKACHVTVTRRGILSAALPHKDGPVRFLQNMATFRAIASAKLAEHGLVPALRVTAQDVQLWRRMNGRAKPRRQKGSRIRPPRVG